MTLSSDAEERLADLVELQPTKNAELQERWGLESGSEVHQYLEEELGEYYFRNDDSLICATPKAEALVAGDDVDGGDYSAVVRATELQREILACLPDQDEEPQSVVATLHALRERDVDTDVDGVRSALHALVDRGAVERVSLTVPTFRLAVTRADLVVEEAPA